MQDLELQFIWIEAAIKDSGLPEGCSKFTKTSAKSDPEFLFLWRETRHCVPWETGGSSRPGTGEAIPRYAHY